MYYQYGKLLKSLYQQYYFMGTPSLLGIFTNKIYMVFVYDNLAHDWIT